MSITISKTWTVSGNATDLDFVPTIGIYDLTVSSQVVNAGTNMTRISTGVYQYTFASGLAGHNYVATKVSTYLAIVYTDQQNFTVPASAGSFLNCSYVTLTNTLAWHLYGQSPDGNGSVIAWMGSNASQSNQILRAIQDGLMFVYGAYRWSFLRPRVSVTTYPAYSTGTITVDASGNVTGTGTAFPSYSAAAGGQLWILSPTVPGAGNLWPVLGYNSGTSITLQNYTGGAITTASTFSLSFNQYPMPAGFDSWEKPLTFAGGPYALARPLPRVDEYEIRARSQRYYNPKMPEVYATVMNAFDPTQGSARSVMFWPSPDQSYTLSGIALLRPLMIDATNCYPLGGEVLASVLIESCLAAAERNVEGQPGPHSAQLVPLLQMAIQRDKEYAAPDSVGIDYGGGNCDGSERRERHNSGGIWWDGSANQAGAGYSGWL